MLLNKHAFHFRSLETSLQIKYENKVWNHHVKMHLTQSLNSWTQTQHDNE